MQTVPGKFPKHSAHQLQISTTQAINNWCLNETSKILGPRPFQATRIRASSSLFPGRLRPALSIQGLSPRRRSMAWYVYEWSYWFPSRSKQPKYLWSYTSHRIYDVSGAQTLQRQSIMRQLCSKSFDLSML